MKISMKTPLIALTLPVALAFAGTAAADQLRIPVGQQAADKQHLEKPRNGQTKQQVQETFGEPSKQNGAVGDPPISSWEYADYIVYFEYNRVLHTVLKGTARPVE